MGKSFFSYAFATALATGTPFIGSGIDPKRILYFDEENSRADLSAYARWTWRGLGSPSRDLLRSNLRIESRTLTASSKWSLAMRVTAEAFKPDLIIVDTATPACHILNENDNSEASIAAQQIRQAQDASGHHCAALILKHLRVDQHTGSVDVRGAKHWKGAVDAIWYHLFRPGRPRGDGWRNTHIRPEKTRAYGLKDELLITPEPKPNIIRLIINRRVTPLES